MQDFFAPGEPVRWSSAPGRLDVMGGIADYSGATVLQLPLACRTTVLIQAQQEPRCDVATARRGSWQEFSMPMAELTTGVLREPAALAAYFSARPDDRWAAYVVGVLQWCLATSADTHPAGLRVLVVSGIPEAMGVASSAALEVATLTTLVGMMGIEIMPEAAAERCQWIENHVVGAPCGIMDQMTSVCGRADHLLRLHCQPATIEGFIPVPAGYRFFGLTSGARHAVTGADYGTVRTAAFMGYRILAEKAGLEITSAGSRRVRIDDPRWGGYLANIMPDEFDRLESALPEHLTGAAFLDRYRGITDSVTRVEARLSYPVRQATAHPVREQARILRFASVLDAFSRPADAAELGRLMGESHRSYSACGLGSDATDRLVSLAEEAGRERGIFGAKITGGGSGGTVAVLGTVEAEKTLRDIASRYAIETGRTALVLPESGPGAYPPIVGTLEAREALDLARGIAGE